MTREQQLERIIREITYRNRQGQILPSYVEDTDLREFVDAEDRGLLEEVLAEQ